MSQDFSGDEDLSLRDECFHADLVMLRFHLDGIEQVLSSISQLTRLEKYLEGKAK